MNAYQSRGKPVEKEMGLVKDDVARKAVTTVITVTLRGDDNSKILWSQYFGSSTSIVD